MENNRNTFTGTLGFVLAAAGSAVGLGNIWRFPYLAARGGGGLFLLIYIVLVLTFGFSLLTTEISIGRKTRQSPLTAYGTLHKKSGFIGVLACIVPMMILPYYCVIGGWVVKYLMVFITGAGEKAAQDSYFSGFITDISAPIIMTVVFLFLTMIVVLGGVEKGIENFSKVIMPILVVLIVFIAIFTMFMSHTDADGTVRTGFDGLKIFFIPNLQGITFSKFLNTLVDAMGQLFYSLSVAMGIMVAYGSYMKDDTNLVKAVGQIEIFDSAIAFLAGTMIIPAVYVFAGREGMEASGPGLVFISLPKIFMEMGKIGHILGALFFAMVLFAAVTSSVSILEAVVSSFMDQFHMERTKAVIIEGLIALAIGIVVCLGYNKFYFEFTLPNGAVAQILDILDYISNNVLMPVVAISTCVLIGWILKPQILLDEISKNGEKFGRKKLFVVMIKFVAPILLLILLIKAFGLIG